MCNYWLSNTYSSEGVQLTIYEEVEVEICTHNLCSSSSISSLYWFSQCGVSGLNNNSLIQALGDVQYLNASYLALSIGCRSCHQCLACILEVGRTIELHIQQIG